jgi:hypothetical protein
MKVFNMFPEMFWNIFFNIFPPYNVSCDASLGLLIRPGFDDRCMKNFDENLEKGMSKFINEKIQEVYRQLPRIDNDLGDWALIITKG